MALAALTDSVVGLAVGVLLSGVCWTLFLIARQGFMIDVVPVTHRARAMSFLGGSYRVGVLIGPLIGAGLIALTDLTSVFWLGAAMSVVRVAARRRRCPTSARRSGAAAKASRPPRRCGR